MDSEANDCALPGCQACGRPLERYRNVSGVLDALGCGDCQLYWSVGEKGELKAIKHVNELFEMPCPVCARNLKKYQSVGGAVGVYGCTTCSLYWTPSAKKDLTPFDPYSLRPPPPTGDIKLIGDASWFGRN